MSTIRKGQEKYFIPDVVCAEHIYEVGGEGFNGQIPTSAYILLFNDAEQILAVKNERGWDIPGGKIEEGENAEQAARRELQEEASASAESLHLFTVAHDVKTDYVMAFYKGNLATLNSFNREFETTQREFMHPLEFLELYGGGNKPLMQKILKIAYRAL